MSSHETRAIAEDRMVQHIARLLVDDPELSDYLDKVTKNQYEWPTAMTEDQEHHYYAVRDLLIARIVGKALASLYTPFGQHSDF